MVRVETRNTCLMTVFMWRRLPGQVAGERGLQRSGRELQASLPKLGGILAHEMASEKLDVTFTPAGWKPAKQQDETALLKVTVSSGGV
jgi:hypothetical protein